MPGASSCIHQDARRFNMKKTRLIFAYIFILTFNGACIPRFATKEDLNRIADLEKQLELGNQEKRRLLKNIQDINV